MALSKIPYRGTRDFFPEQMRLRNYMFSQMSQVSEKFSYEPYDGPLLEEVELYLAKSGEELITEQIYSFVDRGDRKVAIRPEMTPTLARMVAQIHREVSKPLRWYAIPNLMRYEKPQKGRLREFWQYNADIFGAPENLGELECLQLAVSLLQSFGANSSHFEILVNDRRIVDMFFEEILKLDKVNSQKLYKIVDRSKKVAPDKTKADAQAILETEEKTALFLKYLHTTSIDELSQLVDDPQFKEKALFKLSEMIKASGLSEYVIFDPTIVRGLDYYTGLVFEIFDKHPENRRAIAGGGAYANLLQIFNEQPLPGIGFGLGEVPLKEFLAAHGLTPDFSKQEIEVMVAYQDQAAEMVSFDLAQKLRSHGLKVELYLGEAKPKKIYTVTDKKNPSFLVLLGSTEVSSGDLQLKNLKTKDIHNLHLKDVEQMADIIKGSR